MGRLKTLICLKLTAPKGVQEGNGASKNTYFLKTHRPGSRLEAKKGV